MQRRHWTTKLVEDRLIDLVQNADVETRIEAAEVLVEKTGHTHREEIVSSLKSSMPTRIEVAARPDILFFRLKLKSSARRVRAWAELNEEVIKQSWSCSMHPRIAALNNGKCPTCGLDLVPNDQPSFEHRAAQRRALKALADNKDKDVPAYTRRILASSAECIWRVFAAGEWLRVAPKVAVPHVRVFLSSPLDLAKILLECGFLLKKENRTAKAQPATEGEIEQLNKSNWFAIHPMYATSLGAK